MACGIGYSDCLLNRFGPLILIAEGAHSSYPPLSIESPARPPCQIYMNINPPLACTASVTYFQAFIY